MIELVLRLGLSLGIVLGLFWAIARTSSRRMSGSRTLLKVRGRQSLSRTSSVAVIEVGNRVLVVGVSEGGVKLLTELDPADLADEVTGQVVAVEQDENVRAIASAPGKRRAVPTPALSGKRRAGAPVPTPLGGSILAPDTWKSAWAAATSKPAAGHAARGRLVEPIHD